MDVSEIPWRLTEVLVAELSVCVALGWGLYEIYSVQKFEQSRHVIVLAGVFLKRNIYVW